MTETSSRIGIIVTAEQIPLLRDIIVAQRLDVYISDTQNTLLLDDQWKPWIRRVKPQRAHCNAAVWLIAPSYSWPDQHSHPRIRQIIAEQLQSCIQMAVMLGATGLVLPIENAQPVFYDRLNHYLALIDNQLTAHNLTLMLATTVTNNIQDLIRYCQYTSISYPLFVTNEHSHSDDTPEGDASFYVEVCVSEADDGEILLPAWTNNVVIGGHDNVSLIRQKVQFVHTHLSQNSDTEQPEDTSESNESEESSIGADDEVT